MWVHPEYRGKGVGSRLIDSVIDWAKMAGKSELLLDVGDENIAAIALYEAKGFRPTGIVGSLDPPREHVKEHQRSLKLD